MDAPQDQEQKKAIERVSYLKNLPIVPQRTQAWYDMRKNKITASSAASLLIKNDAICRPYIETTNPGDKFKVDGKCANPYSSKNEFVLEKCGYSQGFKGNVATLWGQKYEPVAARFYEKLKQTKIHEFGLIAHDTIPFLAASPDGITDDGIMVEIKCPYVRQVDVGIPFVYWVQVQIQLEVCDLEYCDYIENKFIEYDHEGCLEEYLSDEIDTQYLEKGILGRDNQGNTVYPDDTQPFDEIVAFLAEKKATPFVYKLTKYNLLRIRRDRTWFAECERQLREAWDEIVAVRADAAVGNFDKLLSLKKPPRPAPKVLDVRTNDVRCLIPDD